MRVTPARAPPEGVQRLARGPGQGGGATTCHAGEARSGGRHRAGNLRRSRPCWDRV